MSCSLIHHGHIKLLKKAKKLGNVYVALTSDREIKKYKKIKPELNYSNHNFKLLLEALGYQFDYSGEFPVEQLQEVNSKIIRVINTQSINNATDTSYQNNNLIHLGQYIEAVKRKFNDILNLIQFAIKHNKSVYWG